jgi:hypothetical protein
MHVHLFALVLAVAAYVATLPFNLRRNFVLNFSTLYFRTFLVY